MLDAHLVELGDGSIRNIAAVREYGLGLFAQNAAPKAGPTDTLPFEEKVPIQCGGVTVMPGDLILGDDDRVVVIPVQVVTDVLRLAKERAEIEAFVRDRILSEDLSTGLYYPIDEATVRLFRDQKSAPHLDERS